MKTYTKYRLNHHLFTAVISCFISSGINRPLVDRCYCFSIVVIYVTSVERHVLISVFAQTHQSQCLVQDERFRAVDCEIFAHNKPPTMALSTLVVIEMLNALNR